MEKTLCECGSYSGLIVDRDTLVCRDSVKNMIIPKQKIIKFIMRKPKDFLYYCYNCQKCNFTILDKTQAEDICKKYDECLNK